MLVIGISKVEAADLAHAHTGTGRKHQAENVALGMAGGARHGEDALEFGIGDGAALWARRIPD